MPLCYKIHKRHFKYLSLSPGTHDSILYDTFQIMHVKQTQRDSVQYAMVSSILYLASLCMKSTNPNVRERSRDTEDKDLVF